MDASNLDRPRNRSAGIVTAASRWPMVAFVLSLALFSAAAVRLGRRARPPSVHELVGRMLQSYSTDQFERVIVDGQSLAELYPGHTGSGLVLSLMGNALFALAEQPNSGFASDYGVALEYLQRAVDSSTELPGALRDDTVLHMAMCCFKTGRSEEAIKAFDLLQTKIETPRFRKALLVYAELLAEASPPRVEDAYRLIEVLTTGAKVPRESREEAIRIEAQLASANGDYERATRCYRTLIEIAPDEVSRKMRLFDLGIVLQGMKAFADAEQAFREALELRCGEAELDATICYHLADIAIATGGETAPDEDMTADALFAKAFSIDPNSEAGAASLVRIEDRQNQRGDFQAATQTFNRCMTATPARHLTSNRLFSPGDMLLVWLNTMRSHLTAGRHEKFLAMVDALGQAGLIPQHERLYLLADTRQRQGEALDVRIGGDIAIADARHERASRYFLEAAEGFNRLLTIAPASAAARGCNWRAGHCYFKAGKYSTAVDLLENSLKSVHEDAFITQARYELGRSLQAEGQFVHAIKYYDANIRENPGNVFTHFSRLEKGRCLLAVGRFEHANEVFIEITEGEQIKIGPSNRVWQDARFGLATSLHRGGSSDEALYVFRELLDWYPEDVRTINVAYWFAEAMRQKAAQEDSDAERLYHQAIEYYQLVTQKSRLQAFADRIDEVVVSNCYGYIALCYFKLGDYHAAIQNYNDFAERYDNSTEAVYALQQVATCYKKLGLAVEQKSAEKRMLYFLEKYNEAHPEDKLSPEALF